MAVYVDNARIPYGRMRMCHMVADTHAELMAMARKLCLKDVWLQHAGTAREHYDVCAAKREEAVSFGALPVDSRFIARFCVIRRGKSAMEQALAGH